VEKVRQIASEMGYEPNPWARSLRTNRTKMIGLIIPRLTDAIVGQMFEGAEDAAHERGYQAVTLSTRDREGLQRELVDRLLERRVDGIILATATIHDPLLDELEERGVPFVLMNRGSGDHTTVRADDELGGFLATRHLIGQGHRRIGVIAGPLDFSTAVMRLDGYRRAHAEANFPIDESLIAVSTLSVEGGATAAAQLLSAANPPTAIFAVNDSTAIGTMGTARDLGFRIPQDLAVVGFNETSLSAMLPIPLSSVSLPLREMGLRAMDLLLDSIEGKPVQSVILPPRLVVRTSSSWHRGD
jgi:LacI family transcriptional regulator